MFRLIAVTSIYIRYYLHRYMPTNILASFIRTQRGQKWGLPVMLLGLVYFYAASLCIQLIEHGAPGWLHLLVLLAIWNGFKMLWLCLISLLWFSRARLIEAAARRRQNRASGLFTGELPQRVVAKPVRVS